MCALTCTYIYIYMCLSACNRNFRICMYISYIHMYISRLHVPSYNKMFSYVYTHVICILKLSHSKMELTENRWNVKLCTSTHVYNCKESNFCLLVPYIFMRSEIVLHIAIAVTLLLLLLLALSIFQQFR